MTSHRDRKRLRVFFEDILEKASIDYSNKEIQDIQTAVLVLLYEIVNKMNERGLFKISRIEPCGSMAEKTSLWKTQNKNGIAGNTTSSKYMEFDFLAVLEKPDNIKIEEACAGCMRISGSQTNFQLLHRCGYSNLVRKGLLYDANLNNPLPIDQLFKRELSSCVISFCNCLSVRDDKQPNRRSLPDFFIVPTSDQFQTGCHKCSVSTDSGDLKIATWILMGSSDGAVDNGSLALNWESKSMNLSAPVGYTLHLNKNLKRFPIYIDFLPAIETLQRSRRGRKGEQKCFIVSKRCPVFDITSSWRISGCQEEVNAVANRISEKHKKCYMILKYIFQSGKLNKYLIKTAVLNHSTACIDLSGDIISCVAAMLYELREAFESGSLMAYNRPANLLTEPLIPRVYEDWNSVVLSSIAEIDCFKTYRKAFERFILKLKDK